ncbi:hypothetical protein CRG98_015814 [Punica granatum]|uniref:Uncharacterized protein n=1 Tax=Punica granatum TaxID=22663 RepID=A0A2I0K6Q2_PUNGR|nr:hypothetical protein CRG98_015814 [Punica granatum]
MTEREEEGGCVEEGRRRGNAVGLPINLPRDVPDQQLLPVCSDSFFSKNSASQLDDHLNDLPSSLCRPLTLLSPVVATNHWSSTSSALPHHVELTISLTLDEPSFD